ncbi:5561_t:CDS:2 [Diversispora eburnea]|uniref:5561_t:CDS:1 n=1 Tax=Diversispora eburnea TaxID=1213867 RepID=A0A9N8YKT3_9GLOM|nr:5561_t:CDS:2 [Diversispora eburnea]
MHHTFLLISDVHYRLDNVEKLKKWLIQKDRLKDSIIVSGDLVNADFFTPLTTEKDKKEFRELLSTLEKFGKPLYYIPGNHDPDTTFLPSSSDEETLNAINFHQKVIQISSGLSIVGFGGSTDAVWKNQPETVVWPAFPKNTESLFIEKLPILLDQIKDDDIILITHVGPSKVGTTDVDKFPLKEPSTAIEAGSPVLRKILESKTSTPENPLNYNIVINIHGHSHYPFGLSHIGQTMVINPGPLGDGRFAILTLSQLDKEILLQRDKERINYYRNFNKSNFWVMEGLEFFFV